MNTIKLPQELITLYSQIFKSIYFETKNEQKAKENAWQEVLKSFELINNQWCKKQSQAFFEMHITKASIDSDGKRRFAMAASNTDLDSFGERMSIDLYKSFIERLDGGEFISLSHYPKLGGKAVLGYITNLYIDGNILKAKGYFEDNELGITAYNAIRKDRREDLPFDKRIRVSIGFYDYIHKHDDFVWNTKEQGTCLKCLNNVKNKVYLNGKLDHAALTRVPALKSTSIEI